MSDTTRERIEAELAVVEQKLAALHAASDFEPDMDFALKTEIGGIRGESRRVKRKRAERWDAQAAGMKDLMETKQLLEARLASLESERRQSPLRRRVEQVLRTKLRKGDRVKAGSYQSAATVTRVNDRTVSFRLDSGFTDRLPFAEIWPLEWDRMYAEWQAEQAEQEARDDRSG